MAIEDPGTLTATCDQCDKQAEMDTTEFAGDPPSWGVDDSTLEAQLWSNRNGQILCEECSAQADAEDEDEEKD